MWALQGGARSTQCRWITTLQSTHTHKQNTNKTAIDSNNTLIKFIQLKTCGFLNIYWHPGFKLIPLWPQIVNFGLWSPHLSLVPYPRIWVPASWSQWSPCCRRRRCTRQTWSQWWAWTGETRLQGNKKESAWRQVYSEELRRGLTSWILGVSSGP